MKDDIMSTTEFKRGLLKLCDDKNAMFITDRAAATRIWSAYIDADDETKADCTKMLRRDLAELKDLNNEVIRGGDAVSKFDEKFSDVVDFTDKTLVITKKISREEAAREISLYVGAEVDPEEIKSCRVRFGFCPENIEDIKSGSPCWYSGASGKGSLPVWVYY